MEAKALRPALEKFHFYVIQQLDENLANDFAIKPKVDFSPYGNFVAGAVTMCVKQEVLGQRLSDTITLRCPLNWKEALKEHFAPAWFKRRWPVQHKETAIDVLALYPKISLPGEEYRIVCRVLRNDGINVEGIEYGRPRP